MISTKNIVDNHTILDLARHDHVWVIRGFKKGTGSSLDSAVVRNILGRYLGQDGINITRNANGKPHILPVGNKKIHLSLSHTHNLLLLAISSDDNVGIDVELIKKRKFMWRIAVRYFAEPPKSILDFYRAWTAREAFVKAIGGGIFKDFSGIQTRVHGRGLEVRLAAAWLHKFLPSSPRGQSLSPYCGYRSQAAIRRDLRSCAPIYATTPKTEDDRRKPEDIKTHAYSVKFFYPDHQYVAAICRKNGGKDLRFFDVLDPVLTVLLGEIRETEGVYQ